MKLITAVVQSGALEEVEPALAAIQDAARTGAIGDGKIWVTDMLQVIRVRTGETGPTAIRRRRPE